MCLLEILKVMTCLLISLSVGFLKNILFLKDCWKPARIIISINAGKAVDTHIARVTKKLCPVKFSRSVVSSSLRPCGLQHARLPCPSWILLKLLSIKSVMPFSSPVMPSSHLILCCPLLLPPSIFSSIRIFSNESALHIRWPKYWSCSFNISPSNEYSGLIYFRMDWLDLLAVQGMLKSLLQHHSSKASILRHSAFFMIMLKESFLSLPLFFFFCFRFIQGLKWTKKKINGGHVYIPKWSTRHSHADLSRQVVRPGVATLASFTPPDSLTEGWVSWRKNWKLGKIMFAESCQSMWWVWESGKRVLLLTSSIVRRASKNTFRPW